MDRAYSVTDVRVYSNAARTDLSVNGVALGTRTDCPQRICIWPAVRLAAGVNTVVARGTFDAGPSEDRVTWSLSPDAARTMRIDSGELVAATLASGRFGSDAFFEGGSAATLDTPGRFIKPPVAAKIAGTADASIATTYRKAASAIARR